MSRRIPNFCVPLPPSHISSMEVSFLLQHCSGTIIKTPPPPPPPHRSLLRLSTKLSPPRWRCSLNPKFPSRSPKKSVPIPARDRIIKFGKHKGKMFGALPSSYLQWMYKNSVVSPDLAKEVLDDPVYRDRIEWEYVQRILHADFTISRREQHQSDDVVADIREIADKFDWDMGDRRGWSKVKLDLLGTSFSGPIPRKNEDKAWWSTKLKDKASAQEEAMLGDRRRERRERSILKSDRELGVGVGLELGAEEEEEEEEEEESRSDADGQVVPGKTQEPTVQKGIRFPGRQSLFEKVKMINNRKRLS